MMLDELRIQIDETDKELAAIFVRRMEFVRQVAEAKHDAVPVLDSARETQVRKQFLSCVPAELGKYADSLLDALLSVSKEYQNHLLS